MWLLVVLLLLLQAAPCAGIWKRFDLVRWSGVSGSDWGRPYQKISSLSGGGPPLQNASYFGGAVSNVGDLDGDGVEDIMVGAWGETSPDYNPLRAVQVNAGAAYVLFMHANATVREWTRIGSSSTAGAPPLFYYDRFGYAIANLGDLDGDGIPDVAVSAPGLVTSVVFVLFMQADGNPREFMTIRGFYSAANIPTNTTESEISRQNSTYTMNPTDLQMTYMMGFGRSLCAIGDLDGDGVTELAIGSESPSDGRQAVYVMFLRSDGTVKAWTKLASAVNGIPEMVNFNQFGSAVVPIGDINNDNITDIAVGAQYGTDGVDGRPRSGVVYVIMLNRNGTAQETHRISALSQEGLVSNGALPLISDDNCGASLANVGDMNRDAYASQRPTVPRLGTDVNGLDIRRSIEDIIMGCPQTDTSTLPGRLFALFLDEFGGHKGYRELPHPKRDFQKKYQTFPRLAAEDSFGSSLATYSDVDDNGLVDLIVGAWGDDDGAADAGAVYILFLRRRRWHSFVSDHFMYLFSIFFPISFFCCCCLSGCSFFCWHYRRKPDLVELAVKQSNISIGKNRERKRQKIAIASEDDYPT